MIALDTNILVYLVTTTDRDSRHSHAVNLFERLGIAGGAIVPIQVIGEFLNVCRRKKMVSTEHAARRASQFINAFDCPQTSSNDLIDAFALSTERKIQYFDALILTIAKRAGATLMLSEDMQDGETLEGIRILNPFNTANWGEIDTLLP